MSLDLICPQRLSTRMVVGVRSRGLASDDLDIADERTAEIHHISCGGSQRTRFEPEHLVYSMMLSTNVRPAQSHREER